MNVMNTIGVSAQDTRCFTIGDAQFTEKELLAQLRQEKGTASAKKNTGPLENEAIRKTFLNAGCEAVQTLLQNDGWVQFGVTLDEPATPELYSAILGTLGPNRLGIPVKSMFFMHKPPGLRLRYQCDPDGTDDLAACLWKRLAGWQAHHLISGYSREIYEPETTLFGGPCSMKHVHLLFARDSRFWLSHHAAGNGQTEALFISLLLLRTVFANLGIVDWEDLGVWDQVRSKTGRSFPAGELAQQDEIKQMGDIIVALWNEPAKVFALLGSEDAQRLNQTASELAALARDWKENIFDQGASTIGVRTAAALLTIFLFNRTGLSLEKQIIAAESLASRRVIE
jgi:thiopeptide-type bacteriocin biosynthesis protein